MFSFFLIHTLKFLHLLSDFNTELQLKELETKLQKATEELSEANKRNEQFKKETATQIAHLESQLAEKDNQVIIGI